MSSITTEDLKSIKLLRICAIPKIELVCKFSTFSVTKFDEWIILSAKRELFSYKFVIHYKQNKCIFVASGF